MSPPRSDPPPPSGGLSAEAIAASVRYGEVCDELAELAGLVNASHGRMVEFAVEALAKGFHSGPGLRGPVHFLSWRLGVSRGTAAAIVCVARRASELPVLVAALRAGEISLDQAHVIARHIDARYDQSATDFAKVATVEQLRTTMPHYSTKDPKARKPTAVTVGRDDHGSYLRGRLEDDQADLVRAALDRAREQLWRHRKDAATNDEDVPAPTTAECLAAVAETALHAQVADRSSSDHVLICYHLTAGPDRTVILTDERGQAVTGDTRRRLLCDHRLEAIVHDATGTPLSVGRQTRHITPKLRRAILHRHHGTCAVPGCGTRHGLELHHITHWEDGGKTDVDNLIPLCHRHHRQHHQDQLDIHDRAPTPTIAIPGQPPLQPVGTPKPPGPLPPHPPAQTPTGERLDHRSFALYPASVPA